MSDPLFSIRRFMTFNTIEDKGSPMLEASHCGKEEDHAAQQVF